MPVHTRRSSAAPARHGASPGRARAGRAAASVDDLLEENLSLRYQVQKLQAVLSGNAGSPARNAAGHGADGEEQKFKHQIKKLQVFMNDHSSQSSALKTKLKGASDYVENLERERGRRASSFARLGGGEAVKLRATKRAQAKAAARSPPISRSLRGALGSSLGDARRSASEERMASGRSSGSSEAPAPRRKPVARGRKPRPARPSPGSPAGPAAGQALGVTSADLEYIFDEVVSLKHKLAQAELKLQRSEEAARRSAPMFKDEATLQREIRDVKEGQAKLVKQIGAQQRVLSEIFQRLSVSGLGVAGEDPEAGEAAQGARRGDREAGHGGAYQVYRTRHPVVSTKTGISGRGRAGRNSLSHPVIRTSDGSRRGGRARPLSAAANTKFALLSAGASTAYSDNPRYVERALNFDKTFGDLRDF